MVTYICETQIMSQNDSVVLEQFERKVLRLYGGEEVRDFWKMNTKEELMELYEQPFITGIVNTQRMRWLRHEAMNEDERTARRVQMGIISRSRKKEDELNGWRRN